MTAKLPKEILVGETNLKKIKVPYIPDIRKQTEQVIKGLALLNIPDIRKQTEQVIKGLALLNIPDMRKQTEQVIKGLALLNIPDMRKQTEQVIKGLAESNITGIHKQAEQVIKSLTPDILGVTKTAKQLRRILMTYDIEKTTSLLQSLATIDIKIGIKASEVLVDLEQHKQELSEGSMIINDAENAEMIQMLLETTTEFAEDLEDNSIGIKEYLDKFSNTIMDFVLQFKSKSPFFYLIFGFVIHYLISPVMTSIYTDQMKNEVYSRWEFIQAPTPAQSAKNANKELVNGCNYDLGMVNCLRVTNKQTPVYRGSKRSSGKIDEIKVNQPVIIEKKKKNWALVSYNNEQGQEVIGWVLTGSLEKSRNK
ncbi:TPA: hypothetical protein ACGN8S_005231 [Bacillus cereus]